MRKYSFAILLGFLTSSFFHVETAHSNPSLNKGFRTSSRKKTPNEASDHSQKTSIFQRREPSSASRGWNRSTTKGTASAGVIERASSGSNVTKKRYVDARYLDSVFKGKLAGKGATIIKAANAHGIDPVFLAAAMAFESDWGRSNKIKNLNNPGGLTAKKKYIHFDTLDEGIYAMAARFKSYNDNRKLYTVSAIASTYAPIGASNDPKGTNGKWPGSVTSIMNKIIQGSIKYRTGE
jgi:beta-N-acetylglucosaminidase